MFGQEGDTNLGFLGVPAKLTQWVVLQGLQEVTQRRKSKVWNSCIFRKELGSNELIELQVQCLREMWPVALLHVAQWPRTNFLPVIFQLDWKTVQEKQEQVWIGQLP